MGCEEEDASVAKRENKRGPSRARNRRRLTLPPHGPSCYWIDYFGAAEDDDNAVLCDTC